MLQEGWSVSAAEWPPILGQAATLELIILGERFWAGQGACPTVTWWRIRAPRYCKRRVRRQLSARA